MSKKVDIFVNALKFTRDQAVEHLNDREFKDFVAELETLFWHTNQEFEARITLTRNPPKNASCSS